MDLNKYAYLWTTDRKNYRIFTIRCYGETQYLIYHVPSKRVKMVGSYETEQLIIQKMIEMGVPILQESTC